MTETGFVPGTRGAYWEKTQMRYKKHPSYVGKYLTIHVGGGDKRIGDFEILEGTQYDKFVGHGMLVRLPEPTPAPVVAPAPAAPAPAPPEKKAAPEAKVETPAAEAPAETPAATDEGSTTKSPAPNVPAPTGGGRRSRRSTSTKK
jgi:hypothetical protein